MGPSDVVLVPFDPTSASREEWARYHRFRRQRHRESRPEDPLEGDATTETLMRQGYPQARGLRFAALRAKEAGAQVGALEFWVSEEGSPEYETNRHLAWIWLEVLAPHRRRGVGRLLLARTAELARQHGKRVLSFETDEEDGQGFLASIGAEVKSRGRESRLHLEDVDWRLVEAWARDGVRRNPTTSLRLLEGPIPEELQGAYCRTLTEVLNQQPFDELDHGDIVVTPEVSRAWEARIASVGGALLTGLTREPDGDVSGLTDVRYYPEEAPLAYQGMTGVREQHRGHGLGKWLKAAMLLHLRDAYPEIQVLRTGNAVSNAAMLSINVRLGFKPHRERVAAQIPLEALDRYLAPRSPSGPGREGGVRRR